MLMLMVFLETFLRVNLDWELLFEVGLWMGLLTARVISVW